MTVTSGYTDLLGATVAINNPQSGDTLNFITQNGISGSYAGGVLTLTGSATPAQYQMALQSVTFFTTSTITTARSLSIAALDGSLNSNSVSEQVDVYGPDLRITTTDNWADRRHPRHRFGRSRQPDHLYDRGHECRDRWHDGRLDR